MLQLTKTSGAALQRALITVLLLLPALVQASTVLIVTPLGDIELELLDQDAPNTVANFLNYIANNRYDNTFFHRSVKGFIIQGGGFSFVNNTVNNVQTFAPVKNEFKVSNTRGTVAMAKLGGQPDSATSQWFINVADNSANLDNQNGGFTVFARVIGNGMTVVDAINQLQTVNAGGAFTDLPVINFSGSGAVMAENLVTTAITEKADQPPFVMNAGLNDAWFNPNTDGQGFFITVFPDLGAVSLAWFTYDTTLGAHDASTNLADAGHRWLTAFGPLDGNRSVMKVDIASGGLFDTPTSIDHREDGTITLTFDDCTAATVAYDIPSIKRQGSVPIQRVAKDNVTLCETLSGQ